MSAICLLQYSILIENIYTLKKKLIFLTEKFGQLRTHLEYLYIPNTFQYLYIPKSNDKYNYYITVTIPRNFQFSGCSNIQLRANSPKSGDRELGGSEKNIKVHTVIDLVMNLVKYIHIRYMDIHIHNKTLVKTEV